MQSILRLTYLFGAAYLSGLAAATDYDECDLVAGDTNVAGVWVSLHWYDLMTPSEC